MLRSNKHRISVILSCMAIILLVSGCSTKKNTLTRRAYHNLTSHYNVFWNGRQSVKDGDKQLKESVKDDYSKILHIYNYGTRTNGMALNSQMDRALEKTSICVQKHSMKFGNKERVKWIDDAYLYMGKAHFYKHDYIPARRTFAFVATEYSDNDIAQVANMWLIKTYVQTEEYPKAIALIDQTQSKIAAMNKPPKELILNMDFTIADYYLAVKDYNNAAKYIKSGLLESNNRDLRTRAMFILGQIYMLQNDADRATEQFKKVIKTNPAYEMAFEARMNMARIGSADNAEALYKMLNKMLKDTKNDEYQDRIYYAMAELAMRQGDRNKAIQYYRKSVAAYRDNRIQQSTSALKVATIFFDDNKYELAQAYYDTAVTAMDRETSVGYDSIMNISQTLNELVLNLNTVRDQDSLLRVAAMDSLTRNAFISKIIANVIEQERIEAEERQYQEQLALMGSSIGNNEPRSEAGNTTGAWYFYNQTALSRGYTDFSKKWGMRKLEDNWRITDKKSVGAALAGNDGTKEGNKKGNDSISESYTNHDIAYYLVDLPLTQQQKDSSNKLISAALYNLGFLYMDRLNDNPRSINSYETLNKRYPGNEKELPSWYALYKMYGEQNNADTAAVYKSRILEKYPESSYAQVILDPDYFKKMEEQGNEASDFYSKTYDAFKQGQYYRVKMNAEQAMARYESDTALMPRFALLDALATGRIETVNVMAEKLYALVKAYPTSGVRGYALDVLKNVNEGYGLGIDLQGMVPAEKGKGEKPEKAIPYIYEPSASHLVMIVCNTQKVRIDPLKIRISDFNKKEHRTESFNVKSVILDSNRTIVTIGNFSDENHAKDYITSMNMGDYIFGGMDKNDYSAYQISSTNYPIFYQEKDLETYKQFLKNSEK